MSKWSLVTRETFARYLDEAFELYALLLKARTERKFHPFSAAIAGAMMIRGVNHQTGGDLKWWLRFIEHGEVDDFVLPPGAIQNIPRSRGST